MSDLIVIGYPDEHRAHHVWAELVKLGHDYLVDLEDAAIIWREENGKVHVTTPAAAATSPGDAHDHEMAKRWGKPVELNRRRRICVPFCSRNSAMPR